METEQECHQMTAAIIRADFLKLGVDPECQLFNGVPANTAHSGTYIKLFD